MARSEHIFGVYNVLRFGVVNFLFHEIVPRTIKVAIKIITVVKDCLYFTKKGKYD
jgi:hypothetical protein